MGEEIVEKNVSIVSLFLGLVLYAMGIGVTMNDFGQVFFIVIGSILISINLYKQ